jgi:hypothetical protein
MGPQGWYVFPSVKQFPAVVFKNARLLKFAASHLAIWRLVKQVKSPLCSVRLVPGWSLMKYAPSRFDTQGHDSGAKVWFRLIKVGIGAKLTSWFNSFEVKKNGAYIVSAWHLWNRLGQSPPPVRGMKRDSPDWVGAVSI